MVKNKGIIFLDPIKDKTILHIFNDLQKQPYIKMDMREHQEAWRKISAKIGIRCKKLIVSDPPLLEAPSISRTRRIGYVIKPKDVDIMMEPFGKKKKIIFSRRIF